MAKLMLFDARASQSPVAEMDRPLGWAGGRRACPVAILRVICLILMTLALTVTLAARPAAAQQPPVITAISSNTMPAGESDWVFLLINGTGLENVTAVRFGGVDAFLFAMGTDGTLLVRPPFQNEGVVEIQIETPNGVSAPNAFSRFYYTGPPSISSVTRHPLGGAMLIRGANLFHVQSVSYGASDSPSFSRNNGTDSDGTEIYAVFYGMPPANGDTVRVQMVGGVAMGTYSSTVAPTVTSMSPSTGSTAGGTTVTLGGTNFVAGATWVTIGGANVAASSVTVNSATSLTFTTPAHTPGNVAVTVTTPDGTSAGVSGGFTYVAPTPAPTLTAILPATGSTGGGTSVGLVGTDFVEGATSVTIGETTIPAASVTVTGTTTLSFTTPAHATGMVAVTVTTSNGTSAPVAGGFTYVATPPIAGAVTATVAFGASESPIALALSGGAATSLSVPTPPSHGVATVSGAAITYTPNAGYSGPDSFTYTATNPDGTSAPATVSVTVSPPVILVTGPGSGALPGGVVGTAYSQTFVGSGGHGGLNFALAGGSLPPGLTLSPGGALSGVPTQAGTYAFSIRASDLSAAPGPYESAPVAYSLTVDPGGGPPAAVPTLSEWAMILFGLLLAGGALITVRRRGREV